MTSKKKTITGDFDFIAPRVVPSFIRGNDAKALYNEVCKTIKSRIWFDEETNTMVGSSTFLVARVDSILRPLGIRVATLRDLSRLEIMEMVKNKHYTDTPAVVLRSMEDSYEQNNAIIKTLAPLIEQKNGRLELPVLITGFDVKPSRTKAGYGLKLVPREDFAVLHDERLSGKYRGERFSEVDEQGLPNFDDRGSRIWYARDGLSRLFLDKYLGLGSRYGDGGLAYSNEYGRVVVVRDSTSVGVEEEKK